MNTDERYMMRCLQLARSGMGRVAPNPMVGSVVVHEGKIIAEGFHRAYGGPHAEVHALESVENSDLIRESTLYVNLEPCAHYGKTPPCALRIIDEGLKRVVVGQEDPNPLVAGRGIKLMRDAGIRVDVGILESEVRYVNRRFNAFHSEKRPYVLLKWAQSADGFMDVDRSLSGSKGINWISAPGTKKLVHQWRSEEMSIMVGAQTLRNDNPALTVREVHGQSPLRLVISRSGDLPADALVLNDGKPTVVINQVKSGTNGSLTWVKSDSNNVLPSALAYLYAHNIASVLVEGGAELLQGFIEAGLWDEALVICAPITLGSGLRAPVIPVEATNSFAFGPDRVYQYLAR